MTFSRLFVVLCAMAMIAGNPAGAMAKSAAAGNKTAPAAQPRNPTGDDTAIPLPKDLTDNADPFDAGPSSTAGTGSRYYQQQQNFREQDPIRDQEGDRIIRQFE